MASGTRLTGSEIVIPDGSLKPVCFSGDSGDEIPTNKLRHSIDFVFDFGVNDAAAMPSSTTNWTVLRPRAAGYITSVEAWMVDTGTTGTANTVDVQKNESTILTGAISLSNSDTDNALKAGTLTTASGVAFSADDRIRIQAVKGTNDGVGLKVRIQGYYVGD